MTGEKITTQELRKRARALGFELEADLVTKKLKLYWKGGSEVWEGNEDKVLGFLLGYATAMIETNASGAN